MGAALRTEHVGSLLRPGLLVEERRRLAAGLTDAAALRAVEDEVIGAAVGIQETIGLDVVGDGEFRRAGLHRPAPGEAGDELVERVGREAGVAVEEARFLAAHTRAPFKIALPSPGWLAALAEGDDRAGLGERLAAVMREQVAALVAVGVPYVQLDNPGYLALLDEETRATLAAAGGRPRRVFADMLAADRALLEAIRGGGATIGLHLSRRVRPSGGLAEGGYLAIAEELFDTLPVDRFLLPFVDGTHGGFECLRSLPPGKVAVLGLIDTEGTGADSAEDLMRQLDAAAIKVAPEQLAISPRDGFVPRTPAGTELSLDDQYRKLVLAVETAGRWFAGR